MTDIPTKSPLSWEDCSVFKPFSKFADNSPFVILDSSCCLVGIRKAEPTKPEKNGYVSMYLK